MDMAEQQLADASKAVMMDIVTPSRKRRRRSHGINTNTPKKLQKTVHDENKDEPPPKCYQQAMEFFQLCQHRKCLPLFLKAENLEYPPSYLKLYTIYRYGCGVPKDMVQAKCYAEKAKIHLSWLFGEARTGKAEAQFNIGDCYYEGIGGLNQDYKEAVRWFSLSAKQGNASAQYELALCYMAGKGVSTDLKESVRMYRLAADQGYAGAQCVLGRCYSSGFGVPEDAKEAVRWYRLAADQGHVASQFGLGICYEDGFGVNKDTKESARLYRLAAAQGHKQSQTTLNSLVYHEQGKLMFLLSYHKRLGPHSSVTRYFAGSSMYEPALLMYIFDLADNPGCLPPLSY